MLKRRFAAAVLSIAMTGMCFAQAAKNVDPPAKAGADVYGSGDLNADAATDVNATGKYASAVRKLLGERKYSDLERIAESDLKEKAKFSGGAWKLYTYYEALKRPATGPSATNEEWKQHLQFVAEWLAAKPESATARIVMAESLIGYDAKLRKDRRKSSDGGSSGEDPVKKSQALQHATELLLKEAGELNPSCPHVNFVKLQFQELRYPQDVEPLFESAITAEPSYFPYYRLRATFLRPEWSGEAGAVLKFADAMRKRIGGEEGAAVYFEIAAAVNAGPDTKRLPVVSMPWQQVREGYAALEELHGVSLAKLNEMALLATRQGASADADRLFKRIGDRWDAATWRFLPWFESSKAWAAAPPEIVGLRQVIAKNLARPGAPEYRDQVLRDLARQFGPVFSKCVGQPPRFPRPGEEIYFRIGANGTIEQTNSWPKTEFSGCLLPSVTHAKVSRPPSGSYWVGILQPPAEGWPD